MRRVAAIAALLITGNAPAAEPRVVTAEGVATTAGDPAGARSRAIADALEQAVAQAGLRIESEATMVGGIVASDRTRLAASGRLLGHQVVSENLTGDLYRVEVQAVVGDEEPATCTPAARLPLHLLKIETHADTDLDPAVAGPLGRKVAPRLAKALARAGVTVASEVDYVPLPQQRRRTTEEAYLALTAVSDRPTYGRLLGGTLRLEREATPGSPFTGTPGEAVVATLVLDIVDAGTGALVERVASRARWRLTSRWLDLLPLGLQPRQTLDAPELDRLVASAARQVARLGGCGAPTIAVVGGDRDSVLLGAGLRDGVRTGDLVRVGDGEPLGGAESGWVVAEVTTVEEGRSLARAVDPSRRERLAGAASAERLR